MTWREKITAFFWPIAAPIRFIQAHFKATLLVLVVVMVMSSGGESAGEKANLYRIDLSGPIFESEAFLAELKKAEAEHVKGLMLVVNSPGGMVPPSVEMMMAIKEYAATRPVLVYASGLLASGSYYAAVWGTEIIANPASIVGSIGVIFQGVNARELLDKIGVKPMVVKSGKYKEVGAVYREWEEYEKEAMRTLSGDIYTMFVTDVAQARKLDIKNEKSFADGQVFLAPRAKEIGLIDAIGNIRTAEKRIAELAGVDEPVWNEKSELESFMERLGSQSGSLLLKSLYTMTGYVN
jgi:protease-4